ncbi:hypothetical protein AMTRI_Chr11g96880 [Amborella trichopoda]
MRSISSPRQSRTHDRMVVRGSGGLICNSGQVQARNPNNFLQCWCYVTCRKKETSRSGKFTWQEAMLNMPIIENEARRAMSSSHYRAERNQSRNQGLMRGKPLTRRGTSPDRRP